MQKQPKSKRTRHQSPEPAAIQRSASAQTMIHPWGQAFILFALTWLAGVGLRLIELPLWLAGDFQVQGQWLMATHDAYHWLSGTEDGPTSGRALPRLLLFLSALTGVAPANIAFWLPVFLAPLVALPVCLVAARWGLPQAGLWAGLVAVAAPGYFQRTRIGFLDDDMLVIPMTVMLMAGFVLWLAPYCREAWTRCDEERTKPTPRDAALILTGGAALGLWARLSVFVYHKGFALVLLIVVLGGVLGLVLAKPRFRALIPAALVLLFAAWFAGPAVLVIALAASVGAAYAVLAGRLPMSPPFRVPGIAGMIALSAPVLLLAAYLGRGLWLPGVLRTWNTVQGYFAAAVAQSAELPTQLGGIAEAVRLPAWGTAYLLSGHWTLALLGTAGFGLLLWKRPLAAMFLPLGAIALGSFLLGARFTVISGAFFGLGLGCGAILLLERFNVTLWKRWLLLLLFLPLLISHSWRHYPLMKAEPVVSTHMAQALLELRDIAPENAMIWNWWDLGHATLYYTARTVVERASPSRNYARAVTVDSAEALRARLMGRGQRWDHHLVVSWDMLGSMESLMAAASRGDSDPGRIQRLTGGFEFDMNRGAVITPGRAVPLSTLLMIEPTGPRRHSWPWNRQGGHVVLNMFERTGYLMDQTVFETMFVQMLLAPGEEYADDFELVVDDFPWVRVYRVRDNGA